MSDLKANTQTADEAVLIMWVHIFIFMCQGNRHKLELQTDRIITKKLNTSLSKLIAIFRRLVQTEEKLHCNQFANSLGESRQTTSSTGAQTDLDEQHQQTEPTTARNVANLNKFFIQYTLDQVLLFSSNWICDCFGCAQGRTEKRKRENTHPVSARKMTATSWPSAKRLFSIPVWDDSIFTGESITIYALWWPWHPQTNETNQRHFSAATTNSLYPLCRAGDLFRCLRHFRQ